MPVPDPRRARVGYVLTMFPRFSETFILTEVLALEELGTEVEIFSLRQPDDGRFHPGVAAVEAPVTYLTRPHRPLQLWDSLRRCRPALPGLADHLDELLALPPELAVAAVEVAAAAVEHGLEHLHAHFANAPATVARAAASLAGVTYSFTAHAKDIFHEGVDAEELRANLAGAATVVTVSEFNLAHLRAEHGEAAATTVRLYNGLDLERFPVRPLRPVAGTPVIAAVGRLVPKKGFADLVDAVDLLVRRGVAVRLDLVGAGAEAEALAAQVARLGLHDAVRLLGPLPQDKVRAVLESADVFAAPCVVAGDGNRDGLPTVLLEAMATGVPCVATPVTGIPEAVRHERTGLLVPESDPAALADALERVLTDPALAARLAHEARALVEECFDARRNARVLADLHTRCAHSAHAESRPAPVTPLTPAATLEEVTA